MSEGNKKQRTTVSIYGQQYTIVGKESSSHVVRVAEYVDHKMREIKNSNPYLDTTKLAVLTSINLVDEHLKLLEKLKEYENEEKEKDR
ncbi:cell division protein ZapA [Thalassobacillus sp. C254]|uniref:cell division protein ZapA n=1 Tax=Thalassobacillus sp. C254 TaxID=1225341 RepID=UPI0006CF6E92|nr:cell division protein ZapA [Thalassobacillus sp. C254]